MDSGGFGLPDDPRMLSGRVWGRHGMQRLASCLSLSHSINETKASGLSPLAVREIWAVWKSSDPYPREARPAVFLGGRPGEPAPSGEVLRSKGLATRAFWRSAFGDVSGMFSPPRSFMRRSENRALLVFRDERMTEPAALEAVSGVFWRARRNTIRMAPSEAGSLLSGVGESLAWEAFEHERAKAGGKWGQRASTDELARAFEKGLAVANEGLAGSFWGNDSERRALDFDFACREAGDAAFEPGSFEVAREVFRSFFSVLAAGADWHWLAGAGEQEAFFPFLCALEGRWAGSFSKVGAEVATKEPDRHDSTKNGGNEVRGAGNG